MLYYATGAHDVATFSGPSSKQCLGSAQGMALGATQQDKGPLFGVQCPKLAFWKSPERLADMILHLVMKEQSHIHNIAKVSYFSNIPQHDSSNRSS